MGGVSCSSILFLLMLLMASTTEMVVEGRTCESQSHKFKGVCLSDTNCASVCKTEGFYGGHCRGLRGRCFCTTHC